MFLALRPRLQGSQLWPPLQHQSLTLPSGQMPEKEVLAEEYSSSFQTSDQDYNPGTEISQKTIAALIWCSMSFYSVGPTSAHPKDSVMGSIKFPTPAKTFLVHAPAWFILKAGFTQILMEVHGEKVLQPTRKSLKLLPVHNERGLFSLAKH